MTELTHKVTKQEYNEAHANWLMLHHEDYNYRSFGKFLGWGNIDFGSEPHFKVWVSEPNFMIVSELAHNKIKMLASPHYRALMKMFIIKTGYQGTML